MNDNAKKSWMTCFLFKEFLSFLKMYILGGMFLTNWHLLILDEHGNRVTLEVENIKPKRLD
jgi:hypothetical protein